jgi:hypothetical protein
MQESFRTGQDVFGSLRIVPLSSESYPDWDRFCQQSDDAWFWHTTQWLKYTLHYRPELRPRSQSFLCLDDTQILAVCPLIHETHQTEASEIGEFSYGSDAGPAPAFANALPERTKKAAMKAVFSHVDFLAKRLNVQRSSFRMSSPAPSFWKSSVPQPNPLMKLGFCDTSMATQVIDLSIEGQQLLRNMRKGHRADISRAEKLMQAAVFDQDTITLEAFERYRLLHQKAAGRITRPLETFNMMYEWIRKGLGILSFASINGRDIGFALVSVYKDGAYYSSSCEDPEYNHLPVGHILQWKTIEWLKRHNCRHYEIGVQFYGSQPHTPISEKELKIAFFKRGFGGSAVPYWRGEKFYDSQYCFRVLNERAAKYAATIGVSTHKE